MVVHFLETTKKVLEPPIGHMELQKHCVLTSNRTPDLALEGSRYTLLCEAPEPYRLAGNISDSIDVVIAYWESDLNWIYYDVIGQSPNQMNVQITVLSKCNEEASITLFTKDPPVVSLDTIQVPNVGGC